MARYANRQLSRMDFVGRFEAKPSSIHVRDAMGAIERLRDNGNCFLDDDSSEISRWRKACDVLWTFLNNLEERRYGKQQDLATCLREFIQEFEHSIWRMYQISCGIHEENDNNHTNKALEWFDIVYKLSTYGIISTWIDDKRQETSFKISINMATGEYTQEHTVKNMKVPKNYRHSTKKI